jgi:hypothetical protein
MALSPLGLDQAQNRPSPPPPERRRSSAASRNRSTGLLMPRSRPDQLHPSAPRIGRVLQGKIGPMKGLRCRRFPASKQGIEEPPIVVTASGPPKPSAAASRLRPLLLLSSRLTCARGVPVCSETQWMRTSLALRLREEGRGSGVARVRGVFFSVLLPYMFQV